MIRRRWTTLATLLLAALLLAGCGGGGDDGVKQDLEAQLEALMAERDAAKTAQQTGEAARAAAEEARATADAARQVADEARATAETERDAAQAAQLEAEAAEAEALAAQAEAVAAEMAAKAAQTTAEAARDGAVKAKADAEAARDEARDGETAAKIALIEAQAAQTEAERHRDNANAAKMAAETARATAETERDAANTAKQAADTARDDALAAKTQAENNLAAANASRTATEADLAAVRQQLAAANTLLATANANLQTATQNLGTANAELTRVKADLEEANDELDDAREARRQAELAQVRAEAALAEARRQRDQAEEDTQDAQQEVQRVTRQVDANARAQGLLMALEAVYVIPSEVDAALYAALYTDNWRDSGNPASVGRNTRQTDIELTALPLTGSTRRSGNFYTATLMRTAPGVNRPERKTVVYTDREKTRTFANHYASSIADDVGGTTSNPRFQDTTWAPPTGSLTVQGDGTPPVVHTTSRGGHPATVPESPGTSPPRLVNTLSASVQGVPGRYGCYDSATNAACRVNVVAAYVEDTETTGTRRKLATLTISPEMDGTLYFDPGSGTISLLDVQKAGAPKLTDEEYITFGWWQERPALVDGTYQAAVFAAPTGGTYSNATGSAEYEGPAVGLYVDRTSEGGTTIYESGDFTATAILRATFSGDNVGVEGDVSGFRTTHGAKNWVVSLDRSAVGAADGTAEIVQAGTSSTGTWTHEFLARHDNVDDNVDDGDDQPIAVTGRFDISIPNVRHIVGAFGAHRTTAPIGQ